jgi:hypothetical protein
MRHFAPVCAGMRRNAQGCASLRNAPYFGAQVSTIPSHTHPTSSLGPHLVFQISHHGCAHVREYAPDCASL